MKRLLIATSLVLMGGGAVLFYYWQQATQLPSWYSTSESISPDAGIDRLPTASTDRTIASSNGAIAEPNAAQQQKKLNAKIATQSQQPSNSKNVNVQLNQKELNHLFNSEVARKAQSSKFASAVKGVNTTVQNGKVESGAVVNLGDIEPNQLAANEQAVVSKLVSVFPELKHRNVYIGLEGKPTVRNGQVQLSDDTRIKLGNLSFTPAELSQRLGVSEEQVRQQINLQLQLGGFKANTIEMVGDRAVVQGEAK